MREAVDYSLLGTVVRLSLRSPRFRSGAKAERRVFEEAQRLSRVFNRFDEASSLSDLRQTSSLVGTAAAPELAELLGEAERWHQRTGGRFDPAPGQGGLPWRTTPAGIEITGDCSAVDLNAIAKGWIVDRAAAAAGPVVELVLNAGGDVLHRGTGSVRVGVENPLRPYDNEPPIATVALANAAIATSGPSRRGQHLWGSSRNAAAGASVIASEAATADVLATALAVADPSLGLAMIDGLKIGVAALVVDRDGSVLTNEAWDTVASATPAT